MRPISPTPQKISSSSTTPLLLAHKQVASVARAAAGELFESMMSNNEIWAAWQEQNPGKTRKQLEALFVSRFAPDCVGFARATLTQMLTLPGLDENTKTCIHEALVLDAQLPGRMPRQAVVEIINKEKLDGR